MNRIPLRWQIPALYAAIMLTVLAAGGAWLYDQQRAALFADAAARLQQQARPIIDRRLNPPANGPRQDRDRQTLAELADELATRDVAAAIYDIEGRLIATGTRGFDMPSPGLAALSNAPDGAFIGIADAGRVLWVLVPARRPGPEGSAVMAQLGMLTAPIDDALGRLAWALVLGIAGAVAAATAVGVTTTRRALRPLQRVVATAQTIASGDLSRRVGIEGTNEVGRLAGAFDSMVAQLEAAFAAQKRFAADAAHELRTPLTALSGSVELLRMGAADDDPDTAQRLLRHLDVELARVVRLTNDLLALSALDAQPTLSLRVTDLSALLREVAEPFSLVLADHDFATDIEPGLRVMADDDRLRQVFINLLDNARKHTPAGRAIRLLAMRDGDRARVEVRDAGEGIPADALPHVFDRFYRADAARSRARGGSGLGLAIAKAIVDAHHGALDVESAEGEGSCFTVSLPIA